MTATSQSTTISTDELEKQKSIPILSEPLGEKSYPLLVLLLSLLAIGPALGSGYWWAGHDARHAVYFLFEFHQAIQDGVLWPRWSPDFAFGYGYPFFNIYPPFSSYVGELFHLIGFDLVSAVKISFSLSVLASGLTMFAFARRFLGSNGGLVAAITYVYLPYHLADVYVRAALAESWGLVWFPLVFWGFYECVTRPRPQVVALTSIAYTLLFVSHHGVAVQVTFLLISWVLFWLFYPLGEDGKWLKPAFFSSSPRLRGAPSGRAESLVRGAIFSPSPSGRAGSSKRGAMFTFLKARFRGAVAALGAAILGLTLGGIFVFPWVLEYNDVNTDQWVQGYFAFPNHFLELWQLFSPFWGFGISVKGPDDTFPFQLGIVPLLFAITAWVIPARDKTLRGVRFYFTVILLLLLWLTLESSSFLWHSSLGEAILKPMQFPWRFLVLAGFPLSLLAGFAGRRAPTWGSLLLALVLIAGSYSYLHAKIIEPPEGAVGFAGLMRFQQSAGEMTGQSRWVDIQDIPTWSPLADRWVAGEEVTSRFAYEDRLSAGNSVSNSYQEITEVRVEEARTLRWMITYYPGWHAYRLALDSDEILEELEITPQEKTGHLTIQAPAGHYRYMVRFEDTPVRVVGKVSSALSLLIVGGLLFWGRRKK
ncbi:MAG: hypothetical protein ACPGWR_21570 [Ardenticatenaceae bacterium]